MMGKNYRKAVLKWSFVFLLAVGAAVSLINFGDDSRVLFADVAAAEKPLRLHVLANSDSTEDQKLKLLVRDHVINELEPLLATAASKEEAMGLLQADMTVLTDKCNDFLADKADYQAVLSLQSADFPEIDYNGLVFAAGEYDSLRIVLGEGAGHNWWCVLFPPLCFVDLATENAAGSVSVWAPYSGQETTGLSVRWKLSELFS